MHLVTGKNIGRPKFKERHTLCAALKKILHTPLNDAIFRKSLILNPAESAYIDGVT